MIDEFEIDNPEYDRPSKSQRKREMTALQDMGQKLLTLKSEKLKALALPDQLIEAIALAQRLTRHEAIRRQGQYIGRLMRDLDEDTINQIKRYLEAIKR
jgi:ribosome-associated protein